MDLANRDHESSQIHSPHRVFVGLRNGGGHCAFCPSSSFATEDPSPGQGRGTYSACAAVTIMLSFSPQNWNASDRVHISLTARVPYGTCVLPSGPAIRN